MKDKAIAVVGVGAIMPDATDAKQFWQNILAKRDSIREVPANRWSSEMYYNPDPSVPDKTYSKIGSWVDNFEFNPFKWGIMIPPKVLDNMDEGQKWAIAASHEALTDYGFPERELPLDRVAVIFGNAMAGEKHYKTNLRIHAPQFSQALTNVPEFQKLPPDIQKAIVDGMLNTIYEKMPAINEDTMPGELGNIIAGRVANVFNFGGANFVTDAACASSMAALQAAVEGLASHQFDAVLTGGIDRNNGAASFVKFSKIGALSADGSRPYADGANGFVMGEGGAVFLLKRLEDAERDKDKIYAVVRGIGSSSDGKGKGITAPNPIGQERAIERAWQRAGVNPASVGLIEGHGTSTRVGDRVETLGLATVFGSVGLQVGSVGLGSVKSNIGHLKSAAGAAGLLKVFMALHEKTLPPSANFHAPNPEIDFDHMPFYVVQEARPWPKPIGEARRAGVSSFGFGGTNFHIVVEEYVPGLLTDPKPIPARSIPAAVESPKEPIMTQTKHQDYDNMLMLDGENAKQLETQLTTVLENARSGKLPEETIPTEYQPERLVISYADAEELLKRGEKALKGLTDDANAPWQAYAAQGIYRSNGKPGKVAFLFPGQGSQYANMLRDLAETEPVVAETYAEADRVMGPLLGKKLTDYIFSEDDEESIAEAEKALKNTSITQPAVLTADVALTRLLAERGFKPDMLIGHSLGEYAALVAAGALTFEEALLVVSARGDAMSKLKVEDNGCMAAVRAPIKEIERLLDTIDGYVILANINSPMQSVVGGNTDAVDKAIEVFSEAGFQAVKIPVSHAFHTRIVAPASKPLIEMINSTKLQTPKLPIAANVTGELYPTDPAEITEMLGNHIASSVQFVKGIETLYREGARIFVESGPKRVLNSLAVDILKEKPDVTVIATNHPRKGGKATFHEAICQLYAAGLGTPEAKETPAHEVQTRSEETSTPVHSAVPQAQNGKSLYEITGSVVISGAGLGLPGKTGHVFGDKQIERILNGESFIDPTPMELRQEMLNKRVTRLEKSNAGAQMVTIDDLDQTIKLAGQAGEFNLVEEFGIPAERNVALDRSTQLAIAAGIEALRDAGIPLVMRYKETSTGSFLPKRWMLPESLADETGVIFGSAFPGLDRLAEAAGEYYQHRQLAAQIEELKTLLASAAPGSNGLGEAIQERINVLEEEFEKLDYHFDRKFIFRVLTMGHSQFAEYIGARGPNTAVNAACATTTHAVSIAEDWIRAGRCRRVVIVAGDDITDGNLAEWIAPGLLASGATTTEGDISKAALPFDRRRNGMIMGMGAASLVVESEDAVRERGMSGIVEILATDTANSAFHGTRLDVGHVSMIMERVLTTAEKRYGIDRSEIAGQTMFMSHETYTPARGGSAAAEIHSLRNAFDGQANQVLVANTKGFTGHTMGVGIEDIVSVKALQYGVVPPIANINSKFEPDPELGDLNLSQGGPSDVQYALRLGAGFGSQIAMALLRRIPGAADRIHQPTYQKWLAAAAGYETAELETVQRTLRIKDQGTPTTKPAVSTWKYGTGPTQWAKEPAKPDNVQTEKKPAAPMPAVEEKFVEPTPAPVQETLKETAPELTPVIAAEFDREAVKSFLLGLVSEKTGYPQDVLDLELDLEADLGIDTVKQAELFAAVRENYDIPRREDLMLVDYNTLEKVIGFVENSLSEAGQPTAIAAAAPAVQVEEPTPEPVQEKVVETVPEPAPVVTSPEAEFDREAVKSFLLGLVSEKTGYPEDVLDLELDLEADLGIDTVKQAELFAAVRENYGIPRREDLMLVDYNTLEKVIGFVEDSLNGTGQPVATTAAAPAEEPAPAPVQEAVVEAAPEPEPAPAAPAAAFDREAVKSFLLGLVSEKTGYPQDVLDLELDLEADLGIDTVKQAELFAAVRENYGIPRREDLMLVDYNTLEKVIGFVEDSLSEAGQTTASTAAAPAVQTEEPTPAPVQEAVAVAAAPAPAAPAAAFDREAVKSYLLGLVSEKTGYPEDVLDLELDLEADLGIDTVKQAELFAAVRENYGIPRREDLMLVDYNTLEKVIGFVEESLSGARQTAATTATAPAVQTEEPTPAPVQEAVVEAAPEPEPAPAAPAAAEFNREAVKSFLLGLVSEKTGYPQDVLDLELDLEADLGIDTVKQAELFAAVRENYSIPRREDLMLVDYNTLEKVIGFVEDSLSEAGQTTASTAAAPAVQTEEPTPAPVQEAVAVAAAPAPAAPAAAFDREAVKSYLLGLVSEKTGYPEDVLDLELDLEADLGIDTVKQAELFAAVRENYGIPRREDLMLVDYNTLEKVIGFVEDSLSEAGQPAASAIEEPTQEKIVQEQVVEPEPEPTPEPAPTPAAPAPQAVSNPEPVVADPANDQPEETETIRRSEPIPMLRPRLDLCVPTGVKLDGASRLLIVEDHGPTAEALADKLLEMRVEVLRIRTPETKTLETHLQNWLAEGKIDGVYFLPGLEPEKPFSQLTLDEWQKLLEERVYTLYHLMRQLPVETFLVSATATGGLNGYGGVYAQNTGGGVSGFTKALALERPNTLIKVVDFHQDANPQVTAAQLIGETLHDPAMAEIGYEEGQRYSIATLERSFESNEKYTIPEGSVFLVSGGTGGITLPVVLDLAEKTAGRFYLLGRSPLPDAADPDLVLLQKDGEDALQKNLMQQAKDKGEKLTPVQAREQAAKMGRAAATLEAIDQIKTLGGKAHYLTAELTDQKSVEYAVNTILQEDGRVDVLVHAAGVEYSRSLDRKPLDEFTRTIEVKATGFFHLFKALQKQHIMPKTVVLFSSIAGRFGNNGQTDYSAANDLLAKIASHLQGQHPAMRITALDWGPWAEVGMASRGGIPRLMSMAGIEMMPPDEAARKVYAEITRGRSNEAMFSGSLGMLANRAGETPALDVEAANQALRAGDPIHIMLSSVTGFDHENGVTLEVELDPEKEPFLHDHSVNGTPLLPGVMGIEGFSVAAMHIASVLGAGENYSFRVARLEDIQFLRGFKFHRSEPRHIIWKAQPLREAHGLVVAVTLESKLPERLGAGDNVLHFSGKVHLQPTQQPLQTVADAPPKWNGGYTLADKDIYKLYFHGPSFQVLEGVQREGSHIIGKLRKDLPPITSQEVHLDTTPLLIELCLQTAGIWEVGMTGAMRLPHTIGKVNLYRHVTNGVPVYARVTPKKTEDGFVFSSQVIDAKGRVYLELENYRTVDLPQPIDKPLLEPLAKLLDEQG